MRRVCILGAESTGKTTLARSLAERYGTLFVPEYGAAYHHIGRGDPNAPWTSDELVHIATIQNWLEDFLAGFADAVLFSDTDAYTTGRFHELYLGAVEPRIEALVRTYDLYLICDVATPFELDPLALRREEARAWMDAAYRARAEAVGAPAVELRGPHEERVEAAAAAVDALLARGSL